VLLQNKQPYQYDLSSIKDQELSVEDASGTYTLNPCSLASNPVCRAAGASACFIDKQNVAHPLGSFNESFWYSISKC
jgi:hypothetical protein